MDRSTRNTAGRGRSRPLRPALAPLVAFLWLGALPACDVVMGPPPESDPPLIEEGQYQPSAPPPPTQPTEPQAWSRDLDFDGGEERVRRGELAKDLVAAEQARAYSGEQLTYRSADVSDRPPSEAELIRERARKRLEAAMADSPAPAAKVAPPAVVAAPVENVSAEALPDQNSGDAAGASSAEDAVPEPATEKIEQAPSDPPPVAAVKDPDADDQGDASEDIEIVEQDEGPHQNQTAALPEAEEPAPMSGPGPAEKLMQQPPPAGESDGSGLETWDAPAGTILVQISAIEEEQGIVGEWERLKKEYPEVLGPLRLVVEEAKLGDRGVFFRVQAGGFESQEEAEAACVVLTGQGQPCFVVERSTSGSVAEKIEQAPSDPPPVAAVKDPAADDQGDASDDVEIVEQDEGPHQNQTAALPEAEEPAPMSGPGPAEKLMQQPPPAGESDGSGLETWDAPAGTILVQVSAIEEEQGIVGEWERLKKEYPGVLGPLRLVVEEAKLGDRGVFFRVQAGGFESQEEAEAACVVLTGQGQPCFVVERSTSG